MAPKYTITYHRNHSSSDSTTQSFTQSSSSFTLMTVGELGWEAPSGYSFSEWNTAADGSGMPRDPDMTASAGDWYAIWEPIPDPVPYITTDTELTSVANAIRTKGGTSAALEWPTDFVDAIDAISGGGGGVQTAHIEFDEEVDGWYTDGNMTVQAAEYDVDYDTGTATTKFDAAIGTLVFTSVIPLSVPSALTLVYSISRSPCRLYKVTG